MMKTKYIALATALSLCVFSGQVLAKKKAATAEVGTAAYGTQVLSALDDNGGFFAFSSEADAESFVGTLNWASLGLEVQAQGDVFVIQRGDYEAVSNPFPQVWYFDEE